MSVPTLVVVNQMTPLRNHSISPKSPSILLTYSDFQIRVSPSLMNKTTCMFCAPFSYATEQAGNIFFLNFIYICVMFHKKHTQ
jgi:hypothetical protein